MGTHKTQTISHHCGVVFSGSESPWTPWNKSVFQRLKEKCAIISKPSGENPSFFLQIIFLLSQGGAEWGRRDMERKGKGRLNICAHSWLHRDGNTRPLSQHSTPVCYGFGCGCSHATNFPQSNCKQEINLFTILTENTHLWFQITHVKPV